MIAARMSAEDGRVCTSVANLSRECSYMAYDTDRNSYQQGDMIVRDIIRVIRETLGTSAAIASTTGKCRSSVHVLACASVFPECRQNTAAASIPNYSRLLSEVGSGCGVKTDRLTGSLLDSLERNMRVVGRRQASAAENSSGRPWRLLCLPHVIMAQLSKEGGSENALAVVDLLTFAAFAAVVWGLGWVLVRQWQCQITAVLDQLRYSPGFQPEEMLRILPEESVAVDVNQPSSGCMLVKL
ncbi:hypothetical protein H4R24_000877 [Coemansia sp. RSA 988]|nr:hypothetical protein H4R24_000877 [Coemansia sp. RSA 988]